MLASVLVFAGLQSRNKSQHERVQSVVTDAAESLTLEVLEALEMVPFDSAPPSESDEAPLTLPTAFGPSVPIAEGTSLDSLTNVGVLQDLDDYDGLRGVRVEKWLAEPVVGVPQPLVFHLDIDVEYARPGPSGWVTSAGVTRQKRTYVTARWRQNDDVTVRLARIYSDFRSLL